MRTHATHKLKNIMANSDKRRMMQAYFLNQLADFLSKPENDEVWRDAARACSLEEPGEASKQIIIGRLRREADGGPERSD